MTHITEVYSYFNTEKGFFQDQPGWYQVALSLKSPKEHLEIVKWLHYNGLDCCTTEAMDLASENGHIEIVKYLRENGAPITETAIRWASLNGHFEIVKYLKSMM